MVVIFEKVADVKTPSYGTPGSAGLDFYIPDGAAPGLLAVRPLESIIIPSGIKCKIPEGYCGVFLNKSSVAKLGLIVGAQVIDSDYRGEVHLHIINASDRVVILEPGQKIAQMLIMPAGRAQLVEGPVAADTERNSGGFGSTGKF